MSVLAPASLLQSCPFPSPSSLPPRDFPSFPTRRSSDLPIKPAGELYGEALAESGDPRSAIQQFRLSLVRTPNRRTPRADRKSTRLNSSHTVISYAVFCLKKKTGIQTQNVDYRRCTHVIT